MAQTLSGKTVAILATDGVELVELTEPMKALKEAGAAVEIVSLKAGDFQGFNHLTPGDKVTADKAVAGVDASAYSALMLPGGVANPDQLRAQVEGNLLWGLGKFVRAVFDAGKPVAAICHAPWLLIEAGVVEGRTMTAFNSIRTDLRNAGADVVDEPVVVDQGLVTSRNPDDIPAFNAKMIEEFAEGRHREQAEKTQGVQPVAH